MIFFRDRVGFEEDGDACSAVSDLVDAGAGGKPGGGGKAFTRTKGAAPKRARYLNPNLEQVSTGVERIVLFYIVSGLKREHKAIKGCSKRFFCQGWVLILTRAFHGSDNVSRVR